MLVPREFRRVVRYRHGGDAAASLAGPVWNARGLRSLSRRARRGQQCFPLPSRPSKRARSRRARARANRQRRRRPRSWLARSPGADGLLWYQITVAGLSGYIAEADLAWGTPEETDPAPVQEQAPPVVTGNGVVISADGSDIGCRIAPANDADWLFTYVSGSSVDLSGQAVDGWQPVICAESARLFAGAARLRSRRSPHPRADRDRHRSNRNPDRHEIVTEIIPEATESTEIPAETETSSSRGDQHARGDRNRRRRNLNARRDRDHCRRNLHSGDNGNRHETTGTPESTETVVTETSTPEATETVGSTDLSRPSQAVPPPCNRNRGRRNHRPGRSDGVRWNRLVIGGIGGQRGGGLQHRRGRSALPQRGVAGKPGVVGVAAGNLGHSHRRGQQWLATCDLRGPERIRCVAIPAGTAKQRVDEDPVEPPPHSPESTGVVQNTDGWDCVVARPRAYRIGHHRALRRNPVVSRGAASGSGSRSPARASPAGCIPTISAVSRAAVPTMAASTGSTTGSATVSGTNGDGVRFRAERQL